MQNYRNNMMQMYRTDQDNLGQNVFLNNAANSYIPVEELEMIEKRIRKEKARRLREMNALHDALSSVYVTQDSKMADHEDKLLSSMSSYRGSMDMSRRSATAEESSLTQNNESLERQIQISMNAALKRNQLIYILKVTLLFVGVSIIPAMLYLHDKLDQSGCVKSLSVLFVFWVLFVISTVWSNIYRHPLFFDRFIFKMSAKPTTTSSLTWEERSGLNKSLSCYDHSKDVDESEMEDAEAKNRETMELLLKQLHEKKLALVREEDFRSADSVAALIREIETGISTGDSKAGFSSIASVNARISAINSAKNRQYMAQATKDHQRIKYLRQNIKKYQEEVRNNETKFKAQSNTHVLMGDMKELAESIDSSTKQIEKLQQEL